MPDLERLTDSLSLHLTKGDPVAQARAQGTIEGKRQARKELVVIVVVVALASIAWKMLVTGAG